MSKSLAVVINIPENTKYVAQDPSGAWYAYKRMPYWDYEDGMWLGANCVYVCSGPKPKEPELELYELTS